MLYSDLHGAPTRVPGVSRVDPKALAEFQAGIRKRYSDDEILGQLRVLREAPRPFADDA